MAFVYDFDGTLAPGNLQENSFIPDIGMKPDVFWEEVKQRSKKEQADPILMYMHLMLDQARAKKISVRLNDFKSRGKRINFFEGVPEWFDRINEYGRERKVNVEHYVVSSGSAEIIEGTSIASKFKKVYASKFVFDENDVACWPALAINFTTKTQFLFRINKEAHDLSDNDEINRFVEMKDRPVPFENIIYIGDGFTDVPCFRLVKELGGLSIVVFKPYAKNARQRANCFIEQGRVHGSAPADYTEGKKLDQIVKNQIDLVAARESQSRELGRR